MACLRTEPFSGAGAATSSGGRNGRETPSDGFMVSPIAANWTSGNDSATIEPLEGGGASSPSLRGPSSMISRPEPRAGHRARLRPRLRSLLRLPRPRTAPGAPDRPSRSILRPWVRCAADFRPGPAAGTVGLPLPTLRRRVATIAAAAQRPGSRRSRNTRPCVSSYAAAAALAGRPCGEEGAAAHRAATDDLAGDARRRARDAQSGATAPRLCEPFSGASS